MGGVFFSNKECRGHALNVVSSAYGIKIKPTSCILKLRYALKGTL